MKTLFTILAAGALTMPAAAGQAKKRTVDPNAEAVLRRLAKQNKSVKAAVFLVSDSIDEVQPDGRKLQFSHLRKFTVLRPGKLKLETTGDRTRRTIWKDGKTLTVLDLDENVYSQVPDPGTIDQAVDMLTVKYGIGIPAGDLLSSDIYTAMTAGDGPISYVGTGYAGEEKCHHLAFSREDIDWQLWVSLGDKPSMRKLVITYKNQPGEPQYTMQLLKIEDASKVGDAEFAFAAPKGAEKIDFKLAEKGR